MIASGRLAADGDVPGRLGPGLGHGEVAGAEHVRRPGLRATREGVAEVGRGRTRCVVARGQAELGGLGTYRFRPTGVTATEAR